MSSDKMKFKFLTSKQFKLIQSNPSLYFYASKLDYPSDSSDEEDLVKDDTTIDIPSQQNHQREPILTNSDDLTTNETTFALDSETPNDLDLTFRIKSLKERICPSQDLIPVDSDIQSRIQHFHQLMSQGVLFNNNLEKKRDFRNPHLYTKFVEYLGLEEHGSNFPPNIYDPGRLADGNYLKLNELYSQIEEKRKAALANRTQVDFVSSRLQAVQATKQGLGEERISKKTGRLKKSKWDVQDP